MKDMHKTTVYIALALEIGNGRLSYNFLLYALMAKREFI